MKTVIIVNGRPRVGKDSTIQAMENILLGAGIATEAFSSIDPVRKMLMDAGIDVSEKTEADRALMAEVGDAVEKHSGFRTTQCVHKAGKFFDSCDTKPAVMFLHVREKVIIDRIKERLERLGVKVLLILVVGPRAIEVQSNAADAGVMDIGYDDIVTNASTLDDLAYACDGLLVKHGVTDELSLLRW